MMYLDNNATTACDCRIADYIYQALTNNFENASSIDRGMDDRANSDIKKTTQKAVELIQASPQEVTFTSGATEGINLAI